MHDLFGNFVRPLNANCDSHGWPLASWGGNPAVGNDDAPQLKRDER